MAEITNSSFFSNIPNTTVAACFTSSGTLPLTITPAEVLFSVVKGYREAQVDFNDAATVPPYVNTVGPQVNGPTILTDSDGDYRVVTYTTQFRQYIGPNDINPQNGTTII